jgi:hypothetical protein
LRAVSISVGDHTPSARRRRQVSKPSTPGKHQVEHDRVVLGGAGTLERRLAAGGHVDADALALEPPLEQVRQLDLVVDHEHAHPRIELPKSAADHRSK